MSCEIQSLDKYLARSLKRLSEDDCRSAIKILNRRIENLRSTDYYRTILVEDLGFSTRAFNALLNNKLDTVGDILDYGLERLGKIPEIGTKTHKEIKDLLDLIVAKKEEIIGLTDTELAFVLHKKEG